MRFEAACPTLLPSSRHPGHRSASSSSGSAEPYRRLAEIFHDVLSEQSLDALLERIADTLAELIPYEDVHIYEADESKRELRAVLARGRVGGRGHERVVLVRRGHHGLGRRPPRGRAREPGAPRPARPLRPRDADRARGAHRRPPHRARPAQGHAQHLSRRRGRSVLRRGVPSREALRRRGGPRHRQRAHPRAARAPGRDGRADRPLQPPRLPRPAPAGAPARVGRARDGRGRDARPRRLQEGQRRLRPRDRRPPAAPGRRRPPRVRACKRRRLPRRRRGVRGDPPRRRRPQLDRARGADRRAARRRSRPRPSASSRSRPVSPSGPRTQPIRASSSHAPRSR